MDMKLRLSEIGDLLSKGRRSEAEGVLHETYATGLKDGKELAGMKKGKT